MKNRKSEKKLTFWVTALNSKDRLRYPPVSLFFDMCLTFWGRRGVWEHLFCIECKLIGSQLCKKCSPENTEVPETAGTEPKGTADNAAGSSSSGAIQQPEGDTEVTEETAAENREITERNRG